MRRTEELAQTLRRVADRTAELSFKCWGFGEAIAMLGLLAAARACKCRRYRDVVEASFIRWWSGRALEFKDHVAPGVPLIHLALENERWMPAALALGSLFTRFPRRRSLPVHRPDLEGWASHVWVDCMYTDGPFLALLARATRTRAWENLACGDTLAYIDVLWDAESGFFYHGYDAAMGRANEVRWGRGNGWALLGLVDLLRFLPSDNPARARPAAVVRRQVEVLAGLQDRSGHWRTVLDCPQAYLETSIAAMTAWAIPQAVRLGLIADAFLATAAAAFEAAWSSTDAGGNLFGVSEATPVGDLSTYTTRPTGVHPWGQGAWLLALADRVDPDGVWEGLP